LDRENVVTDYGVPLLALFEALSFSTTFVSTFRSIQDLIWWLNLAFFCSGTVDEALNLSLFQYGEC